MQNVSVRPSYKGRGNAYAGGNSRGANRISGAIPPVHPAAPTIGVATAGSGTATANWTAPAYTGGSPVTGYSVRRHNASTGAVLGTTTVGNVLTSGAITSGAGTAVKFSVAAINAKGTGPYTSYSNSVTPS